MPVAEQPWHLRANQRSAQVRTTRRQQRAKLRGRPPREVIPTLLDPPPELASYTLQVLFASGVDRARGVIPMFGHNKLHRVLVKLRSEGHHWAQGEKRLRDLTRQQRHLLVSALMQFAPVKWVAS